MSDTATFWHTSDGEDLAELGRHVRYRADDVLEWIEENVRTSTSGGGRIT